jgi:[ribosomal protein S5]-alanine N-acetyltransferase
MTSLQFPTLHTARLYLRELNPVNYSGVMQDYTDAEIKLFFGLHSDEELESEKSRFREGMTMTGKSFLYFHLLDKGNNTVMGWCGFHTWFTKHRRAEIGYVLNHDQYKGKGFMKEALPVILKFGFENMDLHRIEALVAPDNTPSLKLLQKTGFIYEGLLRQHYMKNGQLEDSAVYSLLRNEYVI